MTNTNIFEVAVRNQLRFSHRGLLSVEDLWQLDVEELDTLFKKVNSTLKQAKEDSLLDSKSSADKELDLKIEIIRHIVSTKLQEQEEAINKKKNNEQRQKIMEILSDKEEESLHNKSPEELKEILNNLK